MPLLLAVILGLVQGLTEFLPVSSSGHLVVLQHFLEPIFGASHTPLAFDVLVHLATLLVTLWYLRRELIAVVQGLLGKGDERARAWQLAAVVVVGTLPAVLVVVVAKEMVEEAFASVRVAATGFLVTALLLEFANRRQQASPAPEASSDPLAWRLPTVRQALLVGLAQALAITPGISRSGSTVATGLLVGLPAESAVRFSFYLLIPAVLGACVLELGHLGTMAQDDLAAYAAAFAVTAVVGWFALNWLVRIVHGRKLRLFAIYTAALSLLTHLMA